MRSICTKDRKLRIIFAVLSVFGFAACQGRSPALSGYGEYATYRDVPGVTEEEIAAIESLRRSTSFFTYGMSMSTESFRNEHNITSGFSALVCQWLTGFFDIRFRPVIYEWDSLLRGLESRDISFSGEIASSLRYSGKYYMTDSIAERKIQFVSIEGADKLAIAGRARTLKYGFLTGTTTEALVSSYIRQPFEPVAVSNYTDAYQKLVIREIDALFMDETVEGRFALYGNLIIEDFLPLTYNMVSLATEDPKLRPIISVIQKYLQSAGGYHFAQMYEEGHREYLRYNLFSRLNTEERDYLKQHQDPDVFIPVSIEYDNYPVSFYNTQEHEWQGIAVDMLREMEQLTGMRFIYVNTPFASLGEVMGMLEDGQAAMTTELIRSSSWEKLFLSAEAPYLMDYYAFISGTAHQDITLSDVPYKRVGLILDTPYAEIFYELFPHHTNTVEYRNRSEAIAALERGDIELLMATRNLLLSITNYLERTGYKANLVLHRPYESAFGFAQNETVLSSIISKTQILIDTERAVDNWTRRVFDYSGALARAQKPYLIGVSILLVAVLVLLMVLLLRNRQMSARLECTVQQRTHELRERSRELEIQTAAARVASQAKGSFLARMSHEIRTPLNAIIGMTEIARRARTGEKKDAALEEIAAASDHLLGILNDVLDMSKIESGKFTIIHDPFVLRTAMDEVAHIILQRCEEKQINFETDFSSLDDIAVTGDKLRLKQVLINLLSNAVKFSPEGGRVHFLVKLCGGDEKQSVLLFRVSDNGIGMTGDQMKNLFSAFEQADDSISVRFGGTGLGLAISQNLVKQMGGLITVESAFGEGSSFEFTLRMDTAENVEEQAVHSAAAGSGDFTGKRILLAEDIEINRMILKELLSDTHLKIEDAVDGLEAVKDFSSAPIGYYDLIFMDVQMPNLDGHEATRRIRALHRKDAKTIPIIAMTANAYREDIDNALASGMNEHLAKPIDMGEVMKVLSRWLGPSGEKGPEPSSE